MKKSLVITTIATVLVIVVALTTATFAWFSSSQTTNLTSTFQAQASNAVFNMYKYESGPTGNYAFTPNTSIDFTDISNGSIGQYGYWTTSNMAAMAPQVLITEGAVNSSNGNLKGLPNAAFYTASSDDGSNLTDIRVLSMNDTGSATAPNVARFKLENGTTSTKAVKITVTVNPTNPDTTVDIQATAALRFLMIAVPTDKADTTRNKGFVFGTQYEYGLLSGVTPFVFTDVKNNTSPDVSTPDGIPDAGDTNSNSDYNLANTDAYSSYSGYQVQLTAAGAPSQQGLKYELNATLGEEDDKTAANYTGAKLGTKDSFEIYLYVWYDGPSSGGQMSMGSVAFTINFESAGDLT